MMGPTPQVVLKINETQTFGFPDFGNDVQVEWYVRSISPGEGGSICVTIQPKEPKPRAKWKPGELIDA